MRKSTKGRNPDGLVGVGKEHRGSELPENGNFYIHIIPSRIKGNALLSLSLASSRQSNQVRGIQMTCNKKLYLAIADKAQVLYKVIAKSI